MNSYPPLRLKANEDRRIQAGHLWVFSNEVDTQATPLVSLKPGSICVLQSSRNQFLGYVQVNPHSLICARVLDRNQTAQFDRAWWVARLRRALSLRERTFSQPFYRWVYGESDGLPGLVLERFGDVVIGQIGTAGMEAAKDDIIAAVREVLNPIAMLWKNDSGAREMEGLSEYVEPAFGNVPEFVTVPENGVNFRVPTQGGQKTGWFFDQAANRNAMLKYVQGKRVLDVFCYLGAWGLSAARAGASEVVCVDSSASALATLNQTAVENKLAVTTQQGDAFEVMESLQVQQQRFDVVIIDPPAFIKRKKDIPKGEAAYRKLNQLAMKLVSNEGILISASCSYHLASDALMGAVQKASRTLHRFTQVIEVGGAASDHPIHPAIEETRYLKSLTCRVVVE
jgi:23S rRNA (cytosine1962-C5)-methyltransferase